jgi:hypothetical protein
VPGELHLHPASVIKAHFVDFLLCTDDCIRSLLALATGRSRDTYR